MSLNNNTGLMIIRAWIEHGSSKPLRAQIRCTNDVAAGFGNEMTVADIGEVSSAVETWLEDVVREQLEGTPSDN